MGVYVINKVLIADDSAEALKSFAYQLKHYEHVKLTLVDTAISALSEVKNDPHGIATIVLDYHFKEEDINGPKLATEILKLNPNLQIIICTGDETRDATNDGYEAGAKYVVIKDNIQRFVECLEICLEEYNTKFRVLTESTRTIKVKMEENKKYIREFGMIGCSDSLRNICQTIDLCKNEKSTVLVRGESGTGKELIAKAFHNKSNRSDKSFVAINCGAFTENLIESELFGHKKGAFTGADKDKIGKFELAHKGTIFLDEIGDMPIDLQVKLLRALQEGSFYPVGSTEEVKVDVRVIAATNVELEKAVEEGKFRQDLYYRLKVIEINMPPLRERTEDIEPLILHFQSRFTLSSNKYIQHSTIRQMQKYHWKGNIRELQSVVENLFIFSKTEIIGPENLPEKFSNPSKLTLENFEYKSSIDYDEFMKLSREYMNKQEGQFLVDRILEESSVRKAAQKLNLSKSALYRKLTSFGYNPKEIFSREAAL